MDFEGYDCPKVHEMTDSSKWVPMMNSVAAPLSERERKTLAQWLTEMLPRP